MAAQPFTGSILALLSLHTQVTAADWEKHPSAGTMKEVKAIEELLRKTKQTTLVDKDNGQRLPAEFALITDDEPRRLHPTFSDIGTPAGRLKH